MHTTTITLARYWKLLSKEPCVIQFNDLTRVALTSGFTPKEDTGFEFTPGSSFVNTENTHVWACVKKPTSGVMSVRITKTGRK